MALHDSFFASTDLVEKEVTLQDGSKHKVHFKQLPAIEFQRFREEQRSEDMETRINAIPKLLAASVCEPNGSLALNLPKARMLKGRAIRELFRAVLEVNGVTPEAAAAEGNG